MTQPAQIQDPVTAFALAIDLAINAPDDESFERALVLSEEIAMLLTPEQVEQVKAQYEISYECNYIYGSEGEEHNDV